MVGVIPLLNWKKNFDNDREMATNASEHSSVLEDVTDRLPFIRRLNLNESLVTNRA